MKKINILFSVTISILLLLNIIFYNMYSNEYNTSSSFYSQLVYEKEKTDRVNIQINKTIKNLTNSLNSQNKFISDNCVDLEKLKEIADTGEIRNLASNYLIASDKNAYNLEFQEIYSHGNLCSFTWNIFIVFDSLDSNGLTTKGVAFLIIDPDTRELQHINIMYCFYESDYTGSSPYSCDYSYFSNYIWGQTKQELLNSISIN